MCAHCALPLGGCFHDRHVEQSEKLAGRRLNNVREPLCAGLQSGGFGRVAALGSGGPALLGGRALLASLRDLVGF